MEYIIHPILVHFPIAFLLLYSIIKILPLNHWFPRVAWRQIETILLVTGFVGAVAALLTGEAAERIVQPPHDLVEAHSLFAWLSTWIYGALLLGELAHRFNRSDYAGRIHEIHFKKFTRLIEAIFCNRVLSTLLAFVGLMCISITGMLGGVIVYGTSADPLAPFVLHLLGINL